MMKKSGFTLIELLVVIAVIAVLMGILMPSLMAVKEQARQRVCSSNIKQQLTAFMIYANENDAKFPLPPNPGYWLWDIHVESVNYMLKSGLTSDMFYCPSNDNQRKYRERYWEFNGDWDGKSFDEERAGYIVSGYCYLLQLKQGERPKIMNEENKTGSKYWVKTANDKNPGNKELVIDATLGQTDHRAKYKYNFGLVTIGGMWNGQQIHDRTNHLKTDEEPLGGNMGYLDGHVQWRNFQHMERRIGNPKFWW